MIAPAFMISSSSIAKPFGLNIFFKPRLHKLKHDDPTRNGDVSSEAGFGES
ncbi:hypothetical protein GGQ73_002613 [Rhizobium skierniewicense]|uniref:Uncharacterized protein n=1 Tax=Rhizobium skierniewicense TaxID=984260 RepID=A0A7W6C912_9HYPH|nr:hypothetical protein [Rhizobium skierniewicense]